MEILHSTRSEKDFNRIFFETISVSQWLTGFEWNVFRFLTKIFQGDVNSAVATSPEEDLEVNLISFKITKTPFLSETGQKTLSFFYQIFPGSLVKNALFPSRLTFSRKWFSRKTFILVFCLDFERETSGRVVTKWSTLPEEQLRKVLFTSSDLIFDIVFSLWTTFLGFWPKIFNRDVSTAISASRWTTCGEASFFRINYHFYFNLGVWGLQVWTISEKESGLSELHLTCPEEKLNEKLFLFDLVLILDICSDWNGKIIESSAQNSLVGSRNCLVWVQTKDSNELTFFRTFQFQFFFPTLSGKQRAVLSNTNPTTPEKPMKNEV